MTAIVKDISVHPAFRYHNRRVDFDKQTPAQRLLAQSDARRKSKEFSKYEYSTSVGLEDKGGVTDPGISPAQARSMGFDMSVLGPRASTTPRDDK